MLHQANNNYKCEEGTLYFKSCSRKRNEKEWRTCIRSREEKERVLRAYHASSIDKPGCEDGEMSMPVCVPSLQQQKGTSNCGVFAIAFAYHMAEFDQGIMQNYLSDCFRPREHHFPFISLDIIILQVQNARKHDSV